MADVKWIKITTDIFDDEKIILIEQLPDAYEIITTWFKLLCLAGKMNNSGVFLMNNKIAYTDKMLATIFRMKESTVGLALNTFEQFGMIEIIDGVITIPNWGKHQKLDQLEQKTEYQRNYMREYREKQKSLASKTNSKANSESNVSRTDKELYKEELYKEEQNNTVSYDTVCLTESVRRVIEAWNSLKSVGIKTISRMSSNSTRYKCLMARINFYGIDEVLRAIENIRTSDYCQGKSKYGWVITFDWFVLPNNFPKVLDGNFNNGYKNNKEFGGDWANG